MERFLKTIFDRYLILSFFIFCAFSIMVFQLYNLQIVDGAKYEEDSQKKLFNDRRVIAPRGNIYDRNGIPIAMNKVSYSVTVVKTSIKNDVYNDMLLNIAKLLEKNNDTYEKNLNRYITIGDNSEIQFGSYLKANEKQIKNWVKANIIDKEKIALTLKTPQEIFKYICEKKYLISKKYSLEDTYKIATLRYELAGITQIDSSTIAKDVSMNTVAEIEERRNDFPGVTTEVEPSRKYLDAKILGHILGYVGNLSNEEYKKYKGNGYELTDVIGKLGIESAMEKYLRGKDGKKSFEMDIFGKETKELQVTNPIPGNDITLTIDSKLQRVAMESLEKNIYAIRSGTAVGSDIPQNKRDASGGSVVAISVKTGEVLAMASYPSYDPEIYLANANDKEAQAMKLELLNPKSLIASQWNRAIQGLYEPGSTYKPIVGIAALQNNVITPTTEIYDSGYIKLDGGSITKTCLNLSYGKPPHGRINLERALATSCNIFFYDTGIKTGIDNIDVWAQKFGLGEYTSIEISGEAKGIRSNKETHKKAVKGGLWSETYTAISSIGQGYNAFTPVQLANYVNTIASGGKKFNIHIVKSINSFDGKTIKESKADFTDLGIKPESIRAVQLGMEDVANDVENGTAVQVFSGFKYKVAAKTGTAEKYTDNSNISNNGLFICYAPAEDPQIAVAVVIEKGARGGLAAPVARDIFTEYFKINSDAEAEDVVTPDDAMLVR